MSDRREAGNAAFSGPGIWIGPFQSDPFGHLVEGRSNYVSDLELPDAAHREMVMRPLASRAIEGFGE